MTCDCAVGRDHRRGADNVRSNQNAYGVAVGAGGRVMINRSVLSWNATTGIHADAGAVIEVNDTLVSHNQFGINANNGSLTPSR